MFSGSSTLPNILQYVEKLVITKDECEKSDNAGYLDYTMLCGGEVGKDACQVKRHFFSSRSKIKI